MKLFKLFTLVFCLSNPAFATYLVKDATGRDVRFNQPPSRVACISPSTTELIFSIGAEENLLANSRYCRFPQKATQKIKIGGFLDPDFEKIAQIKPDLFLISRSKNDIFATNLSRFGIPHLYLYEDGLDNILKNIDILGEVFQKEEAKALRLRVEEEIAKAKLKAKSLNKKRAIIMFGEMSAGKNSYAGDLLGIVGAENIMSKSSTAWLVPQKEYIIVASPEVLILESKSEEDFKAQVAKYKSDFVWSKTPAVKNNHIYSIDSDLISIPCTHIIGAISRLSEILESAQ